MSLLHDFDNVFYGDDRFDNFGAALLRLIAKADAENLYRLEQGFPNEVGAYKRWRNSLDKPRRLDLPLLFAEFLEING